MHATHSGIIRVFLHIPNPHLAALFSNLHPPPKVRRASKCTFWCIVAIVTIFRVVALRCLT